MGGPDGHASIEEHADRMVQHLAIEIDATMEQQELRAIVTAAVEDLPPMHDEARAAHVRGVTAPWPLLASCVLGAWLMFSRLVFGTEDGFSNSDHLVGALVITVAVCAMAEVTRTLRFINVLFGAWLIGAPWLLEGGSTAAAWNDIVVGLLVIGLSLPRGIRSAEHYGSWDRFVV